MKNRNKVFYSIIYFLLMLLLCTGCSERQDIGVSFRDILKDISSNIFGMIIRQNEYVYYVNEKSGNLLFRIKVDGTEKKRLNNDRSRIIGIKDNWIYYEKRDQKGAIYRINTEGKYRLCLSKDSTRKPVLSGDWIYYVCEDDYCLYKISLDGLNKIKINDINVWTFVVDNEWIYFLSDGLYKEKSDGTAVLKLVDDDIQEICVNDGKIYYINASDKDRIYKVNADGSGREGLIDYSSPLYKGEFDSVECINISNGYIYYSKLPVIYKVQLDGTNNKVVFTNAILKLFLIDKGIGFTYVDNKKSKIIRFNADPR